MEYEFSSRVVVVLGSEIAGFTHSSKKLVEVGGFPIMWNSETFATTKQREERTEISKSQTRKDLKSLPDLDLGGNCLVAAKKKTVLPHPDLLVVSWWQSRQAGKQASKQNVQSAQIYLCAFENFHNFLAKIMQIGCLPIGCTSFINISNLHNFLAKM